MTGSSRPTWMRGVVRERLGIAPDEIDGGHCPALSRPRELSERLEAYRTAPALPTPNPTLSAPSRQLGRPLATRGQFLSRRSNPTGRSTMRRTLTLILGVALFGILAAVVVASQGADDPAGTARRPPPRRRTAPPRSRTTPPARASDDDAPAQNGVDISGPCDEAEHANDPRCGGQSPLPRRRPTRRAAQNGVRHLRSRCDRGRARQRPALRNGDDDAGDDHGGRGDDSSPATTTPAGRASTAGDDSRPGEVEPATTAAATAATAVATTAAHGGGGTAAAATDQRWRAGPPTLQLTMAGRRTILMVEDEDVDHRPLAEALDREGFDTQVAGTVAEAPREGRAARCPTSSSST